MSEVKGVYDVYGLLTPEEIQLAQSACIEKSLVNASSLLSKQYRDSNSYGAPPEARIKSLRAAIEERMAELTAVDSDLLEIASGKEFKAEILESQGYALLSKAWNALLNADVDTLPTITGYAENDVGGTDLSRKAFWRLVKGAGIQLLCGGFGGGGMSGERHGNFTFMIGKKGLYVAYDYVFDLGKNPQQNDKSFTSAVVEGEVVAHQHLGPQLKSTAEPNKDPAAVKEMALLVAALLKAHYEPKK